MKLDYILVAKASDHTSLVNKYIEHRAAGKTEEFEETENGLTQGFCWANDLPLNATYPDIKVNLLDFWELKENEEKPNTWIWISNLKLTERTVRPVTCAELVEVCAQDAAAGRSKTRPSTHLLRQAQHK